MKKLPMLLLLIAPCVILLLCDQFNMDFTIGLCIYGILFLFNMIYAFLLPRLGFTGKQLLFWNLLLKLCNIPLILLILFVVLLMTLIGGEAMRDDSASMVKIALLACYLLQLSSAMFGFSGFLWCRRYGTLTKSELVVSTVAQLIPCIDVIGSILCYIMFRKEGQPKDWKEGYRA